MFKLDTIRERAGADMFYLNLVSRVLVSFLLCCLSLFFYVSGSISLFDAELLSQSWIRLL